MNLYQLSAIIGLVVLGLVLLGVAAYFLVRYFQLRKGVYYHNVVGRYLKRWCALRRYRLVENLELIHQGRRLKVDFAIVGIFGVVFVGVFPQQADLYGNDGDSNWLAKRSQTQRESFPNPVDRCQDLMAEVRNAFSRKNIYNIQMEQFYIFPCRRYKCFVAERYPVLTLPKFKAVLTRDKYHEEKNVDMDQLVEILRSLQV